MESRDVNDSFIAAQLQAAGLSLADAVSTKREKDHQRLEHWAVKRQRSISTGKRRLSAADRRLLEKVERQREAPEFQMVSSPVRTEAQEQPHEKRAHQRNSTTEEQREKLRQQRSEYARKHRESLSEAEQVRRKEMARRRWHEKYEDLYKMVSNLDRLNIEEDMDESS